MKSKYQNHILGMRSDSGEGALSIGKGSEIQKLKKKTQRPVGDGAGWRAGRTDKRRQAAQRKGKPGLRGSETQVRHIGVIIKGAKNWDRK